MAESIASQSVSFYTLVLICGGICASLVATYVGVGFALEALLGSTRRIWDLPRKQGQLRWELVSNLRFIAMAGIAFAALLSVVPTVRPGDERLGDVALTFFVCWFVFEVYYWGLHRLMHVPRFYRFHRLHHKSQVASPLTGYSMSTVESLGWLIGLTGAPLLLGLFTPISLTGLLAYHALYQIAGNVVGHANVDPFPAGAHKRIASWTSHPIVYHSLHHARFNNHYSFGSSFMDRLLRTEWPDWPSLHAKVIGGSPLTKLSERGTTAPSS
jgi:sterol desaturase/sphingolipid hydroxylase (fatty acid hydroxylase superfamily)